MSPEQLATIILGIVGVGLQLFFRFFPKVSDWYAAQENKGLLMLTFVIFTGGVYLGLACTPFAEQLLIKVACDTPSLFMLLKAFFVIASSQSLTYLYTKK